jgi:hypothetical protein
MCGRQTPQMENETAGAARYRRRNTMVNACLNARGKIVGRYPLYRCLYLMRPEGDCGAVANHYCN